MTTTTTTTTTDHGSRFKNSLALTVAGTVARCMALIVALILAIPGRSVAQTPTSSPAPATYAQLPSEIPSTLEPATSTFDYERRVSDDPDARWREAAHCHPRAQGREAGSDPSDAHPV